MVDSLGFIAHVDMEGKTQTLGNHAEEVARRCSKFCTQIDPKWGNVDTLLGLLHDDGKYQKSFQRYIRHSSGLADQGPARAPHSMAGAIHAHSLFKDRNKTLAQILAYCIGGHHRGLYDSAELENALKAADNKAYYQDMLRNAPKQPLTWRKGLLS